MDLELLYSAPNIEIRYDAEYGILFCTWIGFQSEEALKFSGFKILALFRQRGCTKVMNDNRQVQGSWYHSVEWTAGEWFPMMIDAGLKHFAWVCSKDIFAQLSAKRALPGHGVVKIFYEYEAALEWLSKLKE